MHARQFADKFQSVVANVARHAEEIGQRPPLVAVHDLISFDLGQRQSARDLRREAVDLQRNGGRRVVGETQGHGEYFGVPLLACSAVLRSDHESTIAVGRFEPCEYNRATLSETEPHRPQQPMHQHAGIILCGGRSSRMGTAKWALEFGGETMLTRTLRLLGQVCSPLVVVAAADQELTGLGDDIIVARDRRQDQGPLEGLLAGLGALPRSVEAAYVTSCDVPFLAPGFVRRLFELLGDHAICRAGGRRLYAPAVGRLSHEPGRRDRDSVGAGPLAAHATCSTWWRRARSARASWWTSTQRLATLRNLNTPEEYRAALVEAGFPTADRLRLRLDTLAPRTVPTGTAPLRYRADIRRRPGSCESESNSTSRTSRRCHSRRRGHSRARRAASCRTSGSRTSPCSTMTCPDLIT